MWRPPWRCDVLPSPRAVGLFRRELFRREPHQEWPRPELTARRLRPKPLCETHPMPELSSAGPAQGQEEPGRRPCPSSVSASGSSVSSVARGAQWGVGRLRKPAERVQLVHGVGSRRSPGATVRAPTSRGPHFSGPSHWRGASHTCIFRA